MTPSEVLRDVLDLLLPRGCLACGSRIPPEDPTGLACPSCRLQLRPPSPPFCSRCQAPRGTGQASGEICLECEDWPPILVSARGAVIMDSVASALIHALKYRGWRNIALLMGQKMVADGEEGPRDPLVVPIPTTRWRRRTRGYNQAEALARVFSNLAGFPLEDALVRSAGRSQVRLGPRERAANVRRAFSLKGESTCRIRGRHVILVDDVLTTGATAKAAALTLEGAGVAGVHLRTFARALPYSVR